MGSASTIHAHAFAPRAALPIVSTPPISSSPRGGLPSLSSMRSVSTTQAHVFSGGAVRQFSSSTGGGKRPPWMDMSEEEPAKIFRQLDCHGQGIVFLSNQLIQENGKAVLVELQGMALAGKLVVAPDKLSAKVDEHIMRDVCKVALLFATVCGAYLVYISTAEMVGRILEALGQMRKHAPEILSAVVESVKSEFNPLHINKTKFVVKDEWWQDPKKQAQREAKEAAKQQRKMKPGDGKE